MSAMRSASSMTTISTSLELDVALADEVGEPAGARDEDVDAAFRAAALARRSRRRRRRRRR